MRKTFKNEHYGMAHGVKHISQIKRHIMVHLKKTTIEHNTDSY